MWWDYHLPKTCVGASFALMHINTDLSSLSFADVPEITAMIKKNVFVLHFYLLLFDSVGA